MGECGDSAKGEIVKYFYDAFLSVTDANSTEFLNLNLSHHLLGLMWKNGHCLGEFVQLGEQKWRENCQREFWIWSIFAKIHENFDRLQIKHVLLKGPSLWGELYEVGERTSTDLDLLVCGSTGSLEVELIKLGFQKLKTSRWLANDYKELYSEIESGLTIEIHQKLFWTEPVQWQWQSRMQTHRNLNFLVLERHDLLLHLIGHWALQHSAISLHWYVDIHLLWSSQPHWDLELLRKRAQMLGLMSSLKLFFQTFESVKAPFGASKKMISIFGIHDLIKPKISSPQYLLRKILLRDHFLDVLNYGYNWLRKEKMGEL